MILARSFSSYYIFSYRNRQLWLLLSKQSQINVLSWHLRTDTKLYEKRCTNPPILANNNIFVVRLLQDILLDFCQLSLEKHMSMLHYYYYNTNQHIWYLESSFLEVRICIQKASLSYVVVYFIKANNFNGSWQPHSWYSSPATWWNLWSIITLNQIIGYQGIPEARQYLFKEIMNSTIGPMLHHILNNQQISTILYLFQIFYYVKFLISLAFLDQKVDYIESLVIFAFKYYVLIHLKISKADFDYLFDLLKVYDSLEGNKISKISAWVRSNS